VDVWVDGWVEVKAVLMIAYSNQKFNFKAIHVRFSNVLYKRKNT
jgi:hypothetical protein